MIVVWWIFRSSLSEKRVVEFLKIHMIFFHFWSTNINRWHLVHFLPIPRLEYLKCSPFSISFQPSSGGVWTNLSTFEKIQLRLRNFQLSQDDFQRMTSCSVHLTRNYLLWIDYLVYTVVAFSLTLDKLHLKLTLEHSNVPSWEKWEVT